MIIITSNQYNWLKTYKHYLYPDLYIELMNLYNQPYNPQNSESVLKLFHQNYLELLNFYFYFKSRNKNYTLLDKDTKTKETEIGLNKFRKKIYFELNSSDSILNKLNLPRRRVPSFSYFLDYREFMFILHRLHLDLNQLGRMDPLKKLSNENEKLNNEFYRLTEDEKLINITITNKLLVDERFLDDINIPYPPKKILIKNVKDSIILAKFSDCKLLEDKLPSTGQSFRLSVNSSIIFTSELTLDNVLSLKKKKLNNKWVIHKLNEIKIRHIFIIDQEYQSGPIFLKNELSDYNYLNNYIFINTLKLEEFCILYTTLQYVKYKSAYKRRINDENLYDEFIELTKNFNIDSEKLNLYFYNLIDIHQSIVIFKGYSYSTISYNFFKYGINILSGYQDKSHIVSPTDYTLVNFLNLLKDESLGYSDAVLSINLVDESLYKPINFKHSKENEFNKDKFTSIIKENILLAEEPIYSEIIKKNNSISNDEDFLYYLRFFILNQWIIRLFNFEISEYNPALASEIDPPLFNNNVPTPNTDFKNMVRNYRAIINNKKPENYNQKELNLKSLIAIINSK